MLRHASNGLTRLFLVLGLVGCAWAACSMRAAEPNPAPLPAKGAPLVRSAQSGPWSAPATWEGGKVPAAGTRVQVRQGHTVIYDLGASPVIRSIHVGGTLTFARDRDTLLKVGLIKIQAGDDANEDGFDCDAHVPAPDPTQPRPALEVGTAEQPVPARHTAIIQLVYVPDMDKKSCPAIVCCGGRMDFHGASLSRTWVELGKDAVRGDTLIVLGEGVTGWRVGDQVLVTGAAHKRSEDTYRGNPDRLSSETRRIAKIDGLVLTLDRPLDHGHAGDGDYRSEVANLSRNVVVESADPEGVRGHTMYHRHSAGSISYAEFRHLGKEGLLGRYSLHYHLVGDTMRGSSVVGASIWDSHNRWITIHGTNYLVVRDCVGYRSIGHGYFLEDGTEVYNVLDRNLGVQAYHGKPPPEQVLAFDPNDGAAFWWANGRNTLIRNTACENDHYGFRYDSQLGAPLRVLMPDGVSRLVDIRTLPLFRFEGNESHTEGLYGMVFAGPGLTALDVKHPHVLKNLSIWNVHYGLRPHIGKMWVEDVKINGATYGIYRAEQDHHVYRNIYLSRISSRAIGFAGRADGHGRGGVQHGPFSYDNVTLENMRTRTQLICLNQVSPNAGIAGHFRNVVLKNAQSANGMVNMTPAKAPDAKDNGVAFYFHDLPAPGKVARVVSVEFPELMKDGTYRQAEGITGDKVRLTEVEGVAFPTLLEPVDDLPPATVITSVNGGATVKLVDGVLVVRGVTTDNTKTRRVLVNGVEARSTDFNFHQWEAKLTGVQPGPLTLTAHAEDDAGNVERMPHKVTIVVK